MKSKIHQIKQKNKVASLIILLLFSTLSSFASHGYYDVYISGTTQPDQNSTHTYYPSGDYDPIAIIFYDWGVNPNGHITSQSETQASIKWTHSGTQTIECEIEDIYDIYYGELEVNVTPDGVPTPNTPILDEKHCNYVTLKFNGAPPSGITWYWQTSSSGTDTSNSNSTYQANYNQSYYLRARNNSSGEWSSYAIYDVGSLLSVRPGSISGDQTICYNSFPSTISNYNSASYGIPPYSYQWRYSYNASTYSDLVGETNETYSPGRLTSTMYFKREVTDACGDVSITGYVKITVRSPLSPGKISGTQTITAGETASILNDSISPSGGDGSYTYKWRYSTDGSSWSTAPGDYYNSYYDPGVLTETTYFKRRAKSCGQYKYSNIIEVTVVEPKVTPPRFPWPQWQHVNC